MLIHRSVSHGPGPTGQPATFALAACATLFITGCATPPAPPTAEISAAAAVVAHAAGSGGNEFAPQQMQSARDKMQRANAAMTTKDYPAALALSREAQVDAQLAEAKAESTKARRSADAAREGNRVLREEIQRKTP